MASIYCLAHSTCHISACRAEAVLSRQVVCYTSIHHCLVSGSVLSKVVRERLAIHHPSCNHTTHSSTGIVRATSIDLNHSVELGFSLQAATDAVTAPLLPFGPA